jgi:hypothetical protein
MNLIPKEGDLFYRSYQIFGINCLFVVVNWDGDTGYSRQTNSMVEHEFDYVDFKLGRSKYLAEKIGPETMLKDDDGFVMKILTEWNGYGWKFRYLSSPIESNDGFISTEYGIHYRHNWEIEGEELE